jgi:hypothetical protein
VLPYLYSLPWCLNLAGARKETHLPAEAARTPSGRTPAADSQGFSLGSCDRCVTECRAMCAAQRLQRILHAPTRPAPDRATRHLRGGLVPGRKSTSQDGRWCSAVSPSGWDWRREEENEEVLLLLLLYCIPLVYTVVETRQRRGWSGNARVPHGQKNGPIRRSCKSEVLVTRTSSIMFWPATHFSYLPGLTTNKEGRHS